MQSRLIAFSLFAAPISDQTTLCAETDIAKKKACLQIMVLYVILMSKIAKLENFSLKSHGEAVNDVLISI